ncbi:S24 family peptidase [Sphingobium sp. R-7]|uniref:S24 family peptidase n=1 Tax=Sphingobium sp. R-7 TaxID=3375449 RepID=UPI00398A6434
MTTETSIEILRNRLAVAMKHRNVTAKALARTAGLGETVVRDIVRGLTQDVRLGTVEKLAKALGVSVGDLLPDAFGRASSRLLESLGEGSENAKRSDEEDIEIQQWDISYGMGGGTYVDLPVTGDKHKFSRTWLHQFTHAPADKVFLATGTGDSMTPTIHDSDIVLIDTTQREVRMADRIYAAAYGQTGIIKRLRPMPDGSVKILSDNPSVTPETAYDGELHVVGRVVAIVRRM